MNEVLDIYAFPSDDHLVVYSLHERTAIYGRKVKGSSPWPPYIQHRNLLALSPDGALLAVLDEGIQASCAQVLLIKNVLTGDLPAT
jgi:hypothetical protein